MKVPKLRFKEFNEEWQQQKLADVCTFSKGKDLSKADISKEGNPCILYGQLYTTYDAVINSVKSKTEKSIENLVLGKKNDVLIPSSGETAIDIACASSLNLDNVIIGGDLNILRPRETVNGHFLSFQINSKRKEKLSTLAQGATVAHLYAEGIKKLECFFPSSIEQNKITGFLNLVDQKIQKQHDKVELLKVQKKGFMLKIFNQKLRFENEHGQNYPAWEQVTISDILKLNTRPVPKPDKPYIRLGLRSHAKGTFHELVEKPEEVQMDTLYVVKENDLIVNITFAWEQAITVASAADEGKLVSHRFPTYEFKDNHYSVFYNYFFTTNYMKHCLTNASPGGAGRNRVLNKKDFLNIDLAVPNFQEQIKIGDLLSKIDTKIQFEEDKLSQLSKQKQSFMQQMFI